MTESLIKDWTKLRDWELQELCRRGYEQAIKEAERRGLVINHKHTNKGIFMTNPPPPKLVDFYKARRIIERYK